MKGFAMLKIGEVGWIEKDHPECGPRDAIIKPLAVAPCSSDIHTVWEGAIGERTNLILGHEGVGEVVEVGSLVNDFKAGDRVVVPAVTPDWSSLEAQAGYHQHSHGIFSGWKLSNTDDGVFAEFFRVHDADGNITLIPDGISLEQACMLTDMVPTGFHGAELADVQYGDSVLVIGIGPVGLMSVAGANLRGAGRIICVGTRQICREVAKKYGANEFIGYKDGPIDEQVMDLTNGKGVDKVIIAGGTVETFDAAVKALKPGGKIGNVNYLGSGDYIKISRLGWGVGMGHKQLVGGAMPGGRLRMEKMANLLLYRGLDPSFIITHRFKGLEKVEDALYLMKKKPDDVIKPVVII